MSLSEFNYFLFRTGVAGSAVWKIIGSGCGVVRDSEQFPNPSRTNPKSDESIVPLLSRSPSQLGR